MKIKETLTLNVDCRGIKKSIEKSSLFIRDTNPSGETFTSNNYYFLKNEEPFFIVSGEIHFSRLNPECWEKEIIKMKMGGINVISTYVFWLHHEEKEGCFNWSGCKDLRSFVQLCQKHKLYTIVRIGPFCHGECRNGGLPDWLYSKPFQVRCNDEGYLKCVDRLYSEISNQLKDLYYSDGGPIIGIQVENEFMGASTAWAVTGATACEWIPAGEDGAEHIHKLIEIAKSKGIIPSFYTCTAWGSAVAPADTVLPVWGGYAYWPWLFNDRSVTEHPATQEYIFRDYHNNRKPEFYNFNPDYKPEDVPYACCEMGGGMLSCYPYRFILDTKSVGAMAIIKLAGGCNFLGYYMYHGGTNPLSECGSYLNEGPTPLRSYDFQACIGEYGQIREHYKDLKLIHYFTSNFSSEICHAATVLPCDTDNMDPTDNSVFRYAVRTDSNSGFLFINNYQDHWKRDDFEDVSINVVLKDEAVKFDSLSVKRDIFTIFPFNMSLGSDVISFATAQPIAKLSHNGENYIFFAAAEGMIARYSLKPSQSMIAFNGMEKIAEATFAAAEDEISILTLTNDLSVFHICNIPYNLSKDFWYFNIGGKDTVAFCAGALLIEDNGVRVETTSTEPVYLDVFPAENCTSLSDGEARGVFTRFSGKTDGNMEIAKTHYYSEAVASVKFTEANFKGVERLLLRITYVGDIGTAYLNNIAISDNFCNGDVWDIDLSEYQQELLTQDLIIKVTPSRFGAVVLHNSTMAAQREIYEKSVACIKEINLVPVYLVNF